MTGIMQSSSSSSSLYTPELPKSPMGLKDRVEELKRMLFKDNVSKVGVSAMGGGCKTTLAAALCKDPQVIVSQSPNILGILESLWERITEDQSEPNFQSIDEARTRLKQWLCDRKPKLWFCKQKPKNILVVLDDVAAECQGLPLALEVIGRSLKDRHPKYWESVHRKLSQGEPIDKDHENALLKRLAMSTEDLDNDMKSCFLDLGLFPEKEKIYVAALFDIWTYVHDIHHNRACMILRELESRRLLKVVNDLASIYVFTGIINALNMAAPVQHDVLRSLAIYLAANEKIGNIHKRLQLVRNNCEEPSDENANAAEIILIHSTGSMNEKLWPDVKFPKAQALVLIFAGNECILPTFLQTMLKLKVLIIINQNSTTTKLEGMLDFKSLRCLRLEKLTVPPLGDYIQSLKKLKKLSLSLCKGDKGILDIKVCSQLIDLVE
ncbi:hypothetical protein KI387_001078, partial [Taxus chinensis]